MGPKKKTRAPESTLLGTNYLRRLVEERSMIRVKLSTGEIYAGTVEYFDTHFIRLTRPGDPNLFIFKNDIKYLWEVEEEED
jgi:sRNA-binding regulator protein Hfq